jgi:D-3-phosphoglycerate dehydrogenase / 2-oxoglutarate reductase
VQPTILVTESLNFSDAAAERLRSAARVVLSDLDRQGLLSAVGEAEVLWVRLRHRIDREVMNAAPRLRIIATPTTGLNHIDLQEADRRGIEVISLRGETSFLDQIHATAEHTLALILALLRHVPAARNHAAEGGWNRDLFRGRELHGKTAGVVGYGRVGRMVAGYLQALGMKVLATDTNLSRRPVDARINMVPLAELLAKADLVTLHVALTEETQGFFGQNEFMQMKSGSWFINTSRGELVDEGALMGALLNGRLSGAAVDVLSGERSSGMNAHPLVAYARSHDNLLITPHIGGCTAESMEKTEEFLADKVVTLLRSQREEVVIEGGNRKDLG